ncbi:MAG: FtsX-like permease family protein [Gammaproteobacteria bacterium]
MILWKVTLRHYTRHPWQILLSIVGIALGVAVVVSIDLANSSANKAFELSAEAVSGNATHEIIGGPDGVPDEIYTQLRMTEGLENIAPVVEGYGELTNLIGNKQKTVQILGIDLLAETGFRNHMENLTQNLDYARFITTPNTAVMLQSTAKLFGLSIESDFQLLVRGTSYPFTLIGMIKDTDSPTQQALENFIIVDIATAQEIFGMQGRLSHIDVAIADTKTGDEMLQRIKSILPQNLALVASNSRSDAMAKMTHAFQTNLTALSLLALVVGVFLIYNTMTFAVIQRRDILGYLRTLGATKKQIFQLIFVEAFFIGVISTVLGLFVGVLLGDTLLQLVTRTINDLYFVVSVNQLNVTAWSILKGVLLGVFATVAAVYIPAKEATNSTPRSSYSRSVLESNYQTGVTRLSWVGYGLLAIGVIILVLPTKSLFVSFGGLFVVIMGCALLVPLFTMLLVKFLAPLLRAIFGELGNMSARGVTSSFSRSSVAVTALTIAVATSIGVTVMIDSFKSSVVTWLESTLSADIFITPAGINSESGLGGLSPAWIDRFKALPEVDSISMGRRVQIFSAGELNQLFVLQIPRKSFTRFRLIHGNVQQARNQYFDEQAVLISEPYSFRHNLHVGDSVTLPTDKGDKAFKIAGVYVDYGSETGVIAMHRNTYLKYWNDTSISSIGIYAKNDTNIPQLIGKLRDIVDEERNNPYKPIKEQDLDIVSNEAIRDASIRIFDRTFAVTQVLRLLAIVVAFVGILSALMAIQIERSRELALMRAIGLTPRQLWLVVSGETGIIGSLAGILAAPIGIIIAAILILVINHRSFGWSMDITIDPLVLGQSLALAVLAALLAGIYPATRLSKIKPADALREE